ncbi:RNF113A [Lepeophtheirus salmonis]|uniref:RNF113A n=1 Tax=Lepeophtheirus salmonis TaxID=72036 RepID=A0A7R8CP28_LEPSM|nr:RNF113A [Lepeophtheirus salmonis]CAF2836243.1 RNF113A [Lepeophtheirus salmonis]
MIFILIISTILTSIGFHHPIINTTLMVSEVAVGIIMEGQEEEVEDSTIDKNGYRPKDHRDNRDYRDRSRDHPNQHMMGGRRDHNPRVCKFFAQRGHCRDGERCRFLHDR